MKTVLVAIDFSAHYEDVVKVGYEITTALDASVRLITIINKDLTIR